MQHKLVLHAASLRTDAAAFSVCRSASLSRRSSYRTVLLLLTGDRRPACPYRRPFRLAR